MADPRYASGGARALVLLHETHLRAFLATWKRAKARGLLLPATEDPNYASLDTLLVHVLRASRGYLTWCCEQLGLPDPDVPAAPCPEAVEREADAWVETLLARWQGPLAGVTSERLERGEHVSRWGTRYCLDAMLEHAVMHPIRHAFQLEELAARRG